MCWVVSGAFQLSVCRVVGCITWQLSWVSSLAWENADECKTKDDLGGRVCVLNYMQFNLEQNALL